MMNHQELKEYYRTLVTCHSELCWLFEKEIAEPQVRNLIRTFREEMARVEGELDKTDSFLSEEKMSKLKKIIQEMEAKKAKLAERELINMDEVHEQDNIPSPFQDFSLEELYFLREHMDLLKQ